MLILENAFDRKINGFIRQYTGLTDFQNIRDFLLTRVYKDIPELRLFKNADVVSRVIQWVYDENGNVKNSEVLSALKQIFSQYKERLGTEFRTLEPSILRTYANTFIADNKMYVNNKTSTAKSSNAPKEIKTPTGYTIRRIDSFEEMNSQPEGHSWCIGNYNDLWDEMIGYECTVYLVTAPNKPKSNGNVDTLTDDEGEEWTYYDYFDDKDFYEVQDDPRYGKYGSGVYPYDDYGLSAFVVLVYESGWFSVYSHYNMTDGKDGDYLLKKELEDVLGMNPDTAFPYVNMFENKTRSNNMKRIKLTETQLRSMIQSSIKSVLSEGGHITGEDEDGRWAVGGETFRGVPGSTFIWHGEWSDPEIWYKGYELNGTEVEDSLWYWYNEDMENMSDEEREQFKEATGCEAVPQDEDIFEAYLEWKGTDWIADELDEFVFNAKENGVKPKNLANHQYEDLFPDMQ